MAQLNGKTIAILATDGFEEDELIIPRDRLRDQGAEVHVVSPKDGSIRAWRFTDWSQEVPVDRPLSDVTAAGYDALVLPGGQINPDKLRLEPGAVTLVRAFYDSGKPIAAICHGPWLLIEAEVVRGLTMTSFPSLRTDVRNAGALWVDREVVEENGIITSRKPDDLAAFTARLAEELEKGTTWERKAA